MIALAACGNAMGNLWKTVIRRSSSPRQLKNVLARALIVAGFLFDSGNGMAQFKSESPPKPLAQ
jgi:hypothetical protein